MEDVVGEASAAEARTPDDSRTKTLRILNQYIEKQRSYLARIQADIHRLQPLKLRSEEDPLDTLNRILDGTSIADVLEDATENEDMMDLDGERGGRLDVQTLNELAEEVLDDDGEASILDAIDWELFNGHDPGCMQELASSVRRAHPRTVFPTPIMPPPPVPGASKHPPQRAPPIYPKASLSPLQTLVRAQRAAIVDPVLTASATFIASIPPDSDDERERARLAARRRKSSGLNTFHSSGHGNASRRRRAESAAAAAVRPRGPGGMFLKQGQQPSAPRPSNPRKARASAPLPPSAPAPMVEAGPSKRARRMSSISSLNGVGADWEMDMDMAQESRPRRDRRPSMRVLNGGPGQGPTPPSLGLTNGKGKERAPAEEAFTPSNVRLTIRIPPRAGLTIAGARTAFSNEQAQPSASTSATADYGNYRPSFSPTSTTRTLSPTLPKIRLRLGSRPNTEQSHDGEEHDDRSVSEWEEYSASEAGRERDAEVMDGNGDDGLSVTRSSRSRSRSTSVSVYRQSAYKYPPPYQSGIKREDEGLIQDSGSRAGSSHVALSVSPPPPLPPANEGEEDGDKDDTQAVPQGDGSTRHETFKQSWSVSEQHLLEKLLEEYPDGVKNRWSMISKAMGGRRTPRQVASRVQKYFAKLKKFGLSAK